MANTGQDGHRVALVQQRKNDQWKVGANAHHDDDPVDGQVGQEEVAGPVDSSNHEKNVRNKEEHGDDAADDDPNLA